MPYDTANTDTDIDMDIDMDTDKASPPTFRCDAVLLCAGEGSRFRNSKTTETTSKTTQPQTNKLLTPLAGKPALQHLCERVKNASFARIVLVLPKDNTKTEGAAGAAGASETISALASKSLPDLILVEGGERRQDSLQKALEALETNNNDQANDQVNDWVMVFDAARPLVSAELIARVLLQAKFLWQRAVSACVVPLLPVVDSVKRVCEQGKVSGSIERATLRLAQTPQAASRGLLLRLLRECSATVSDEAQLCEQAGCLVEAVEGEVRAHKITRRADVGLLEGVAGLLGRTTTSHEYHTPEHPIPEYRSATGFDTHKTCEGSSVRLCGVDVPALFSLEGHSDADVALHALTDAVLSLAGAGDIGDLFPPSDERWRDADSALFLVRAIELLAEAGGGLVSLDVTLLLELPHLGKFKVAMRERLAALCRLTIERVGVKAKTLEGLGALGRGEGVGAFATASARFLY